MSALNPVLRLRTQLREALPPGFSRAAADDRLAALLGGVGLPDPRAALRACPCELTGGMGRAPQPGSGEGGLAVPDSGRAREAQISLSDAVSLYKRQLAKSPGKDRVWAVVPVFPPEALAPGQITTVYGKDDPHSLECWTLRLDGRVRKRRSPFARVVDVAIGRPCTEKTIPIRSSGGRCDLNVLLKPAVGASFSRKNRTGPPGTHPRSSSPRFPPRLPPSPPRLHRILDMISIVFSSFCPS